MPELDYPTTNSIVKNHSYLSLEYSSSPLLL